jgi:hypothetical protein
MRWAPTPEVDLKGAISLFTEKEEVYFQKLNVFRTYGGATVTNEGSATPRLDLFN